MSAHISSIRISISTPEPLSLFVDSSSSNNEAVRAEYSQAFRRSGQMTHMPRAVVPLNPRLITGLTVYYH